MEFFCYHRDRQGSMTLRTELLEQHWSYMDQFQSTMIARGPTFGLDGTLTGSVHALDLPDANAARAFALDEPGYQAGAYRDVLLRRWQNTLGHTMWDFTGDLGSDNGYLVLGFTSELATSTIEPPPHGDLILYGPLLSDDATMVLGVAALLVASDAKAARDALDLDRFAGIEVHRWQPGGRPT